MVTLCGAPGALAQPHVALDNAQEHVHAQTLLPQLEDPTASNKDWDQHQRLKTVLDYKLAKVGINFVLNSCQIDSLLNKHLTHFLQS